MHRCAIIRCEIRPDAWPCCHKCKRHMYPIHISLSQAGHRSPVTSCSLWGPPGACPELWCLLARLPAQLWCALWPQNLEPTIHGSSIARTNAVCIQTPAQDAPVPASVVAVSVVYRRPAPVVTVSGCCADYSINIRTQESK